MCQSPYQLQRILDNTCVAIVVLDNDGVCLFANQAALDLLGVDSWWNFRPLASPDISPYLQPDGRVSIEKWHELVQQARGGSHLVFEWELLRPDGSSMPTRITLTSTSEDGLLHCAIDDISDLKMAQSRLQFLAHHDPVTSLPNRHCALEHLNAWLYTQEKPASVGVISLKLVAFREFNAVYGHSMGDCLLQQVAAELSCALQPDFSLYRLVGAEYLLLVNGIFSHEELVAVCERVADLSGKKILVENIEFHLQFSLGASLAPQDSCDATMLLRQASMARDHAKRNGTQRCHIYEARIYDELLQFIHTTQSLRQALQQQEFELHFQPQIHLTTGSVTGAEALIRWNRPNHGLVSPGQFIRAAEECGLIHPLGRWILREACRQAANWSRAGWTGLKVAVNLSTVQLRQESIRKDVFDALEESGLPANCLELELTESVLLDDDNEITETLSRWKSAGIRIAIDDFGTGYSSLSYLKRLTVDKIKIDHSFIRDFLTDSQNRSIVKAVLQMAKSLKLRTVAEGIECPVVAQHLADLGCQEGQGFLYAKPMPAADFLAWLRLKNARRREDLD